ncbi:MAG TPA: acyltransferase [Methylophaga sp.]|nr:acyltransferase [Methylophaga sp.]HEC58021.1 acyltransferase [Methylophaga sp.]
MIKKLVKKIAFSKGYRKLYVKFGKPSGEEFARFEKKWGRFYSIGDDCAFWPFTNITDPEYTSLGNNVMLSACTLLGHDGSISMLNRAFSKKLDRVGKIDIKDNVFIGHGAIILPNVTIGPNAIVAAGAVVSKDVAENSIVAGVPARHIGMVSDLVRRLEDETNQLPWSSLIKKREGSYDADLEPTLIAMRVKSFFPDDH